MNKYNVTRPTATLHLHPDATLSLLRPCPRSAVPRRCPRFGRPLVSALRRRVRWGGSYDIPDSLASRNDGPHLALSSKSGRYFVTWETSFLTAFGIPLVFCGSFVHFCLLPSTRGTPYVQGWKSGAFALKLATSQEIPHPVSRPELPHPLASPDMSYFYTGAPNWVFSLFAFIGVLCSSIPLPWHLEGTLLRADLEPN